MTAVVGYGRQPRTDERFREEALAAMGGKGPPEGWERFAESLYYHAGTFEDPEAFRALDAALTRLEKARGIPPNRLFYFAAPPSTYETILRNLGAAGLSRPPSPGGRSRRSDLR